MFRGKLHNYLGMWLDYRTKVVVKIDMTQYVRTTYNMIPEELSGSVATPAAEHLFEVCDNAEKLDKKTKQTFHTTTARSLFVGKRARPDIQPTVAFLCTRVKEPDEDDWKKLKRLMTYMKGTKNDVLTLSVDDMKIIKWWVDGSYTFHNDYKSHTGATMLIGKRLIMSSSSKQKLNTRSSTETEVVAVDDKLPQILWSKYFLDEQAKCSKKKIQQDNESAQRFELNDTGSSRKRTKHMRVRYFFIKDRLKNRDLNIDHCGTDKMWADYFTKPLQGRKFEYFRALIMGFHMESKNGKAVTWENFVGKRDRSPKECVE